MANKKHHAVLKKGIEAWNGCEIDRLQRDLNGLPYKIDHVGAILTMLIGSA